MTRELSKGRFGFAHAQVAGLLEGCEGVINARDGLFVGRDIEVANCVVDELYYQHEASLYSEYTYSRGILVEQHGGWLLRL